MRAYEHSIYARETTKMGTTDEKYATANFAFSKTQNSGNSSTELCANCGVQPITQRKGKKKFGDKKHAKSGRSKRGGMNGNHRSDSRKCYVCGNKGHIARDCDCDERCDKGDSKKGEKKRNLYPLKTHDAISLATALFQYFCTYGICERIVTDPGSDLTSEVVRHLHN